MHVHNVGIGQLSLDARTQRGRLRACHGVQVMSRAARIASKARPGQVLTSRDALAACGRDAASSLFSFSCVGAFALRSTELMDCYAATLRRGRRADGPQEG